MSIEKELKIKVNKLLDDNDLIFNCKKIGFNKNIFNKGDFEFTLTCKKTYIPTGTLLCLADFTRENNLITNINEPYKQGDKMSVTLYWCKEK